MKRTIGHSPGGRRPDLGAGRGLMLAVALSLLQGVASAFDKPPGDALLLLFILLGTPSAGWSC